MGSVIPSQQSTMHETLWGFKKISQGIEEAGTARAQASKALGELVGATSAVVTETIKDSASISSGKAATAMATGETAGYAQVVYDLFNGLKALWNMLFGRMGYTKPSAAQPTATPDLAANAQAKGNAAPASPAPVTAVPTKGPAVTSTAVPADKQPGTPSPSTGAPRPGSKADSTN